MTKLNLLHTKRILHYNIAHGVKLYRLSSSLVPLATHPEIMWDFITPFEKEWKRLGQLLQKYKILPSFHPNQFTLFTSPNDEITNNAIINMEYHYRMLEALDALDTGIINIHIGGAYGDKKEALERFHENLQRLPSHIKKVMTLENDDKTYNVAETLEVCEKENIPMVLDYHHHVANHGDVNLSLYLQRIFLTWENKARPPKVHISSPKSETGFRSHADFVDPDFILPFLKLAKALDKDFDIMIEAKQKNLAMHRLIEDLSKIRGIKRIAPAILEWN